HKIALGLDLHPFKGDYDRVGRTTLDTWGAGLHGDWTLGPVTLTSVTGWDTYHRFRDTDQDFTPMVLFEQAPAKDHAWQVFQELKAHAELPDYPLRWDAGFYMLKENLTYEDDQLASPPTGGQTSFQRAYTQDLWSYGVYTGFSWDFLDDFTLEGG